MMTEPDKLAIFEPQNDGTTLIRGRAELNLLTQFRWAVMVPQGLRIPSEKTLTARAALEAAGFSCAGPGGAPQPTIVGRTALPLPECVHCAQPYRRDHAPDIDEHCISCGHPLRLIQIDPRADERRARSLGPCAGCGRDVPAGHAYCRCGTPAPQPEHQHQAELTDAIDTVNRGWQKRRRAALPRTYTATALVTPAHEHNPDRDGFCRICQEFTGRPAPTEPPKMTHE